MFTDKELEATKDYCDRKMDEILNKEGGSDIDYIRNLQTLVTLKDAVNKKIHSTKRPKQASDHHIIKIEI